MKLIIIAISLIFLHYTTNAHVGPDPIFHYSFDWKFINNSHELNSQKGPNLKLPSDISPSERGIYFTGNETTPFKEIDSKDFPTNSFTITSWCSILEIAKCGGIVGAFEDNGSYEKGFILGYNDNQQFYIALSSSQSKTHKDKLFFLTSKNNFKLGKTYHLAATYDGESLELYINGKLEAKSRIP